MSDKELFKKAFPTLQLESKFDYQLPLISAEDAIEFAQQYLQEKVNSISDDQIKSKSKEYYKDYIFSEETSQAVHLGFISSIKWFKQKLLE